jgi:hypothetical protein
MKKTCLFLFALSLFMIASAQYSTYNYPGTGEPIITINVPVTWTASVEPAYLTLYPDDQSDLGNMFAMVWKSDDPTAEDAVTALINESFDLVEKLLIDITWDEETSDFQFNGVDFVAIDGWGTYVNEDASRDEMMATVMILFPDDINLLTFVYIGTEPAYMKHKTEFLEIIQSISPSK